MLAGGLIGAVIGPNLAARSRTLLDVPFAGAYVVLCGVALLGMVLMAGIQFPAASPSTSPNAAGRPLALIVRQPVFWWRA